MAATAVRAGMGMHETHDPAGCELLVHALLELPDGTHAPVCRGQLFARELQIGHVQAVSKTLFASEKGRVLICIKSLLTGSSLFRSTVRSAILIFSCRLLALSDGEQYESDDESHDRPCNRACPRRLQYGLLFAAASS